MAIPVLSGPTSGTVVINVSVHYQVRASNLPTSYAATDVPASLTFSTSTGRLQGQVTTAGVYPVVFTATNGDGTSSPFTFTITATDSGVLPPPSDTGVSVYQSKYWTTASETLDIADLDSTGHPVCAFDAGSIGADQLANTAISSKVTAIGGPGLIGTYTFTKQFTNVVALRAREKFGSIVMPGVAAGDLVIPGMILWPPLVIAYPVIAVAITNGVDLYLYHEAVAAGLVTVPAGAWVNCRVFKY